MDSTPQIVLMAAALALTVAGSGAMLWRAARSRPRPPSAPAARLLRRAAWGTAVALVVVVGWMAWESVQRPDVGASFYGKGRAFTGVYWGPFIAFCVAGLGFVLYVFVRAYRRLSKGEWTPPGGDQAA